jgi:hypothetical protein
MATRKEVGERRKSLRHEITEGYRRGTLSPGMLVPPVRELATRHSLSKEIAHQEIQRLVEEGVLYTVPGSGTFFGRPPTNTRAFFLHVSDNDANSSLQALGFAQRIAELGGATLVLSREEARSRALDGSMPPLAGVWDSTEDSPSGLPWGKDRREIPRAGFITHIEDPSYMDAVGLDDYDGGRQATQHLIRLGHKRIAYVGLHPASGTVPDADSWSLLREDGWRSALLEAGFDNPEQAFHPAPSFFAGTFPRSEIAISAAEHAVEGISADVTAVVAANDHTALMFVSALRRHGVAVKRWPAVVGFDNLSSARGHLLTSLHRPLDKVGAAAADMLWDRYRGMSPEPGPIRRLVPMVLLPRITSERGWPVRMPDAPAMLLSTV